MVFTKRGSIPLVSNSRNFFSESKKHCYYTFPLETSGLITATSRPLLKGEILRLNETTCSDDIFLQCTRPLDIDTRKQHGLTLIHVEKIDFIAKTCNHNMYTDMFYFFIYFFVIFRNIQVDISHIFFLVYSAILFPYALYSQSLK